jgi:hypothetical protein
MELIMKALVRSFLALFLWAGCADQGVSPIDGTFPLDANINRNQMTTAVDSRFRLELEVLADAGFQWDCSVSNPAVLTLDSVSFRTLAVPPAVGGPVWETFYFCAKTKGASAVQLVHHQAWLPTEPPRDALSFLVYVR